MRRNAEISWIKTNSDKKLSCRSKRVFSGIVLCPDIVDDFFEPAKIGIAFTMSLQPFAVLLGVMFDSVRDMGGEEVEKWQILKAVRTTEGAVNCTVRICRGIDAVRFL